MQRTGLNPQMLLALAYTREGLHQLHWRLFGTLGSGKRAAELAALIWEAAKRPPGRAIVETHLVLTVEQLRVDRDAIAANPYYTKERTRRAAQTRVDRQLARVALIQAALAATGVAGSPAAGEEVTPCTC